MSHALLSPSAASRWLKCPPSVMLSQCFPDRSSPDAEKGTVAHALGELLIADRLKHIPAKEFKKKYAIISASEYFDKEMLEHCDQYATFVMEQYNAALKLDPNARIYLETQMDLSDYYKDGFGTIDVSIIASTFLHIIDLKYGSGVRVEAKNNSQTRIYGLAGLATFAPLFDIENVTMTIYQPRMDNINSDEATAAELVQWGNDVVKVQALLAESGRGEMQAGDHCRFCKVKPCKTRAEYNLKMAQPETDPRLLSPEEIAQVLSMSKSITDWLGSISEFALNEALAGTKWPGFKLVEGRSNRQYASEAKVADVLLQHLPAEKVWRAPAINTITEIEKELGKAKFAEVLKGLVIKPAGKPTLVPLSDKREEYSAVMNDFADD